MATMDEIVKGVYRIATFDERVGLSFNRYLIVDEQPTLVHTGSSLLFDDVLQRMREALDPTRLAYVFASHFEADECGGLAKWCEAVPGLIPVCSAITARQLAGFGIHDHALVRQEGDLLSLGQRRLGFVTYPSEIHLWDGLLAFDEIDRLLFSSDLFIQRGVPPAPMVRADAAQILDIPPRSIPNTEAREACLAKIKRLGPRFVAPGHGPAFDLRQPGG